MAKKYNTPQEVDHKGTKVKVSRWSDGFSNTKNGKPDKKNKPKKTDSVEFENGTVLMIDESAEIASYTGEVTFFAIEGVEFKVNGKKVV